MAYEFRQVNTAEIREAASKIRSAQDAASNAFMSMNNVVKSLPDVWTSSEASVEFLNKFAKLMGEKERLEGDVQAGCAALEEAARIYDEKEGIASNLLSQLRDITERFGG